MIKVLERNVVFQCFGLLLPTPKTYVVLSKVNSPQRCRFVVNAAKDFPPNEIRMSNCLSLLFMVMGFSHNHYLLLCDRFQQRYSHEIDDGVVVVVSSLLSI